MKHDSTTEALAVLPEEGGGAELSIMPLQQMQAMAKFIVDGGLFPSVTKESQAMTLMMMCHAKKMHPILALEDYDIIADRPTLKTQRVQARFIRSGGRIQWIERTDQRVEAKFTHPEAGEVTVDWDFKRAAAAGLVNKGTWKQYPRAMLTARVISEGIRTLYPVVLDGLYTPEEVSDMDARPPMGTLPFVPPEPEPETTSVSVEIPKSTRSKAKPKEVEGELVDETEKAKEPKPVEPKPVGPKTTSADLEQRKANIGPTREAPAPAPAEKDEIPGLEDREEAVPAETGKPVDPKIAFLAPHRKVVEEWLRKQKWLAPDQGLESLELARVNMILAKREAFLAAVGLPTGLGA